VTPVILVRAGTVDDLARVAEMFAALWPEGTLEEHRAEARSILTGTPPGSLPLVVFVAVVGGAVVGFVEVGLRSHADGCDPRRPVGFVEGWYAEADHRREGVGRALMHAAEVWARSHGCSEMASDTWIDHDVSLQAHAALGFEVVDRCVHFRKAL
jgi:aminoglycoside 6'-N-acetyltransferase I